MVVQKLLPYRGLFRDMAIPFSILVLAASLAMAGWMAWGAQRESLRRFEDTAVTNAKFVEQLRLPKSAELAEKLSVILNARVGFVARDAVPLPGGPWPEPVRRKVEQLAARAPASGNAGGVRIAVAPMVSEPNLLLVLTDEVEGTAGMIAWILAPSLTMTAVGVCLALLVTRQFVGPLEAVTRWLPNLDPNQPVGAEPIPAPVAARMDEIGTLARVLEQTRHRLVKEQDLRRQSERLATLGRIATSLAHEIKNPAAAIGMHVSLLARQVEAGNESILLIKEEIERITDLVNQWLFVARPEPPRTEWHDLAELTRKVARRLAPMLEYAGVTLQLDAPAAVPVQVDSIRIEHVVRNLLVNAVQAMPRGGQIRVQVKTAANRQAEIQIADSGKGFSEEALRRLGEPFYTEREGGMGIGLSLAMEVLQAHGGKLTGRNAPAGGAIVTCLLPTLSSTNAL